MKKEKAKLSESFIVGVIAIVFLMIGYQTAMFIHNAAVTKIAANRDEPDTVYVYESSETAGADGISSRQESVMEASRSGRSSDGNEARSGVRTERKNSAHPPRAEAVRSNLPRRKVESFPFDPNTVSIEDLCRLGFSQKQAQSIDNYRNKGGRFRRKTDFEKSFVVSDSIYKRLEPYINIPKLDLNLADSAAFDALPGIGGWFAGKMIEHRKSLGGYSYKEQLMDIYRFDEEKFKALEDLIELKAENMTPYPLWTLSADSLRKHPYIGNYETARAIVLFRENTSKKEWTVQNLMKAGILTSENAEKISGCLIGQPVG